MGRDVGMGDPSRFSGGIAGNTLHTAVAEMLGAVRHPEVAAPAPSGILLGDGVVLSGELEVLDNLRDRDLWLMLSLRENAHREPRPRGAFGCGSFEGWEPLSPALTR